MMMSDAFIWIGIAFCLSQSAMFSGLNLAFFSLTRLRLEIEAESSSMKGAKKVLSMRKDSNFLLTTILWGNVSINVLLTLLSDSVMAGFISFAFSTVIITFFGEIIPQAYFSRNALRMASFLSPALKFYQIILFPVAKPSAILLDKWLGKESVQYFEEKNIKLFIKKHMEGFQNEIDHLEGMGAINFFSIDDIKVIHEGEELHPDSIIRLKSKDGKIIFPKYERKQEDDFIQKINKSGEKWVVFTDENNKALLALDADAFIRSEIFCDDCKGIAEYCHTPFVIGDEHSNLATVIKMLKTKIDIHSDLPLEKDIVLFWNDSTKKIITGADILGSLLKGI